MDDSFRSTISYRHLLKRFSGKINLMPMVLRAFRSHISGSSTKRAWPAACHGATRVDVGVL